MAYIQRSKDNSEKQFPEKNPRESSHKEGSHKKTYQEQSFVYYLGTVDSVRISTELGCVTHLTAHVKQDPKRRNIFFRHAQFTQMNNGSTGQKK